MADFDPSTITPTEDLVMEVLAARFRTGEHLWTFDSRHRPAIRRLVARGLANEIHGMVENTIRASLTPEGRAAYIDAAYVPPNQR